MSGQSLNWDDVWREVDVKNQSGLEAGFFSNILDFSTSMITQKEKTALEIGCFPGKFIEYLGRTGYKISGIDTYPRVNEIGEWAESRGSLVGEFQCISLKDYASKYFQKYDFVFSLGLIEHFDDFCDVIFDHASLCTMGGIVLIGAPNFASPVQRALHTALDKKNLSGHVLHSMYPELWAGYLNALNFEIIYHGNVGGFGFWSDSPPENESIQLLQKTVPSIEAIVSKLSKKFNHTETAYNIVVGKKTKEVSQKSNLKLKKFAEIFSLIAHQISNKDSKLSKPITELIIDLTE